MSLPYFPVYIGDYLKDTMHLSGEEHGPYLLLIFACATSGGRVPDDDAKLAAIARTPIRRWKAMRPTIAAFFEVKDGWWTHHRVVRELEAAGKKSDRAAESARIRWEREAAKRAQSEGNANAYADAMQSSSCSSTPSLPSVEREAHAPSRPGTLSLPGEQPYPGHDLDAARAGLAGDLGPVWAAFVEHHHAEGKLIASIPHAWRKWCRREIGFRQRAGPGAVTPKRPDVDDMLSRI